MRQFAVRNFTVSVGVLLAYCVWTAIRLLASAAEVSETWGPFAGRFIAWPFVIGGMEALLWYHVFRERRDGTRIMAGFMAVALSIHPLIVAPLVADLYDLHADPLHVALLLYVAASHGLIAVIGSDK